jgi:hypothetical protein
MSTMARNPAKIQMSQKGTNRQNGVRIIPIIRESTNTSIPVTA